MANPWLKKNPLLSMWLSGANRVAGTMRGRVTAEAKRQATSATEQATKDVVNFWTGGAQAATPSAPVKRKKVRAKSR